MSPSWLPRLGKIPVGHCTPLMVSTLICEGVAEFCLKSNVSHGLGAPAINTKMTFFALFSVVTGCEVQVPDCPRASFAKQEASRPAPKTWKKLRHVQSGLRNI